MLDQDIIVTYVANKEDNNHGQPEKDPDDYKPNNNKNADPREKVVPDNNKKSNNNHGRMEYRGCRCGGSADSAHLCGK